MKPLIDVEAVRHSINFQVARATGVNLINALCYRFTICTTHDGVALSADHQYRRIHLLPDHAQVQRL